MKSIDSKSAFNKSIKSIDSIDENLLKPMNRQDFYKHIQNIIELNNIKCNKKKLSPSDNMISECFRLYKNDDIIQINKINIPIEFLQNTEFINNYNKMILLSIMYALIDDFRKLSLDEQMNNINNYMNSIITIIKSRNGSSKRFYDPNMKSQAKIFKKNIIDKDDYSNYMINFYANYLNINIFIIENDCKIMLYTMNKLFNINKPSILLWHFGDKTYEPISIHNNFVLYIDNIEFNNFINNNKIGVYNVLTMKNDIQIKDITIRNEDLLKIGYDNDLEIIYKYLTLPVIKRCSKKSKLFSSTSSLSINNDNNINNNNDENNNDNNKNNNDNNNDENNNESEEDITTIHKIRNKEIDLSTEQAINNVVIESFDENHLKKLKVNQLQELLKKQNISIYIDETKKKRKTKPQMIDELKN